MGSFDKRQDEQRQKREALSLLVATQGAGQVNSGRVLPRESRFAMHLVPELEVDLLAETAKGSNDKPKRVPKS